MEEKKKIPMGCVLGGILFAVLVVRQLFYSVRGGVSVFGILWTLVYALVAAGVIMGKKNPLPVIGFACMALLDLRTQIMNIPYMGQMYYVENFRNGRGGFNVFAFLPTLFSLAAIILAVVVSAGLMMGTGSGQKLWALPAGLMFASFAFGFLLHFVCNILGIGFYWPNGYSYFHIRNVLGMVLEAVAFLFAFMGMSKLAAPTKAAAAPSGNQSPDYQKANDQKTQGGASNMKASEEKYYCGLVKHILLLLFTFGIWQFIWIYRMTEYLNGAEGETRRTPTNQLLLCMFVPFYIIYWVYQSAQRIDKMAHAKGVESDLTMLCLILEIFVAIVPPVLMQEKVNTILTAPEGAAPITVQPAAYQSAPAPVKQAAPVTAAPVMGSADEIRKYKELMDEGAITEAEFTAKKRQLLGLPVEQAVPVAAVAQPVQAAPPVQTARPVEEFDDLPEL